MAKIAENARVDTLYARTYGVVNTDIATAERQFRLSTFSIKFRGVEIINGIACVRAVMPLYNYCRTNPLMPSIVTGTCEPSESKRSFSLSRSRRVDNRRRTDKIAEFVLCKQE